MGINWYKAKFFSDLLTAAVILFFGITYVVPGYNQIMENQNIVIETLSTPNFCSLVCNATIYNISYEGVNITYVENLTINITSCLDDIPRNPDGSLVTPDDLATGRYVLWKMCNETGTCKMKFKIA